jgi:hypothetical protein
MKSCLRTFGVIVVLLFAMTLSSCQKDDDTVGDSLNGTIWFSLFSSHEYKIRTSKSRGYALSFGKNTVVFATLDENYRINGITDIGDYHVKGNTLFIGGRETDYNPNVMYIGRRTYVRQPSK